MEERRQRDEGKEDWGGGGYWGDRWLEEVHKVRSRCANEVAW